MATRKRTKDEWKELVEQSTPLPPPSALLLMACGSPRLAAITRDWTFIR